LPGLGELDLDALVVNWLGSDWSREVSSDTFAIEQITGTATFLDARSGVPNIHQRGTNLDVGKTATVGFVAETGGTTTKTRSVTDSVAERCMELRLDRPVIYRTHPIE
jgi:hypothetical protein